MPFAQMDRCWADFCARFREGMEVVDGVRRRSSGGATPWLLLLLQNYRCTGLIDVGRGLQERLIKILQAIACQNVSKFFQVFGVHASKRPCAC